MLKVFAQLVFEPIKQGESFKGGQMDGGSTSLVMKKMGIMQG